MVGKELPVGRQYRYYVHPEDNHTNNTLAKDFEEVGYKVCSDGEERFLFTTRNHHLIGHIQRDRKEMNLNFLVFIQEGKEGEIRPWIFDAAKPWQKPVRRKKKKAA